MKDGVIADYRVTEAMLKHYIASPSPWHFGNLMSWYHASWCNLTERRAVIEATMKVGPKCLCRERAICQPSGPEFYLRGQHHMVVDGGGTTDVAVIWVVL